MQLKARTQELAKGKRVAFGVTTLLGTCSEGTQGGPAYRGKAVQAQKR